MLSPLLYSSTHDCTLSHPPTAIFKFADDSAVVGLITGGDESAYRGEVLRLTEWCEMNNLLLNTTKTKELILDFRRKKGANPPPIFIKGDPVERVYSFKYLGIHITDDLTWTINTTTTTKKATQRLYFLKIRNIKINYTKTFF